MKNIWTIMKKEFSRFFRDRRLVLSLFLPGILIYVIYSVMGQGIFSQIGGVDDEYKYEIYTVDMPVYLQQYFEPLNKAEIVEISREEADGVKADIEAQEKDFLAVFPADFDAKYQAALAGGEAPIVETYYNSVKTEGSMAYALFTGVLSASGTQAKNYFVTAEVDLASEKDLTGMIFSMIGPMLLIMFLFTGCLSVAPESIAGEKERGSFATMLVTPVKRSKIAVGKILSLSAISLLSGLCSFVGLLLSLPKLMAGAGDGMIDASVYGASDYIMMLGIVLSSVLVIVALISVVSAFAKSVKEATGLVSPLMILVVLLGVSTMFTSGATGSLGLYVIPLYNSVRALSGIFSFLPSAAAVLVTIFSNIAWALLLSFLLAKMFDSERIMFNK